MVQQERKYIKRDKSSWDISERVSIKKELRKDVELLGGWC